MFIGHYKSVNTSEEFYSTEREDLNFPTQVEYKSNKYLLTKTIQISSSLKKNLAESAKRFNIDYDVKVD
jgi:hypothetical protein